MDFIRGKRCLVTGHTGFKGFWLSVWLDLLGAEVAGLSFDPGGCARLYTEGRRGARFSREFSTDLRNAAETAAAVQEVQPEIVFHLAAQPLVRVSYRDPLLTWSTNVMGTANLLQACAQTAGVRSVVVITTDKVYENREDGRAYREEDRLGGRDPYSASKAATELLCSSWRDSFASREGLRLATARAGNVIGGGDWAEDRLVPDAIRAFSSGLPLVLRNPRSTRPWQHVLDPLCGYLLLASAMDSVEGDRAARPWNFGPADGESAMVEQVAREIARLWGGGKVEIEASALHPHEAGLLQLDACSASSMLGWSPQWKLSDALRHTVEWYQRATGGEDPVSLMREQIEKYPL
jgi:CDP-glucose 4,6-dehydratase